MQGEGREEWKEQGPSAARGTIPCHAGLVDVDTAFVKTQRTVWDRKRQEVAPV